MILVYIYMYLAVTVQLTVHQFTDLDSLHLLSCNSTVDSLYSLLLLSCLINTVTYVLIGYRLPHLSVWTVYIYLHVAITTVYLVT